MLGGQLVFRLPPPNHIIGGDKSPPEIWPLQEDVLRRVGRGSDCRLSHNTGGLPLPLF